MQELIEKLKTDAGLTEEQANQSLQVIINFIKEKFPMFEGAIGSMLSSGGARDNDFMP